MTPSSLVGRTREHVNNPATGPEQAASQLASFAGNEIAQPRIEGGMRTHAPYRDATDGKRAYLRELLAEQARALAGTAPGCARRIHARRLARAAAGAVLTLAGVAMFVATLARFAGEGMRGGAGSLTAILLAGWGGAALAWVVTRLAARWRFDARLRAALAPTGDLDADLERARRPVDVLAGSLAARVERASIVWPLVGLALMAPLASHYVVAAAAAGCGLPGVDHRSFDQWIVLSVVIVGHCHLVVAARAFRFGRASTTSGVPPPDAARAGSRTWTWAIATSLVPGLFFVAVPVVLVALTGVFIPIAFSVAAARLESERLALDDLCHRAMRGCAHGETEEEPRGRDVSGGGGRELQPHRR